MLDYYIFIFFKFILFLDFSILEYKKHKDSDGGDEYYA